MLVSLSQQFSNQTIISIIASLMLGLLMCFVYSMTHRTRKDFTATLLLMPFIICVILNAVNSLTQSFIIVSIFALTRFRTVQYKAEEIMSIFASVVIGLLCAIKYVELAIVFTLIYILVLSLYNKIEFRSHKMLRVVIPENMSFDLLEEPLNKYTEFHKLIEYKTTNLGSLYRLTYDIVFKNSTNQQSFIDDVRILNGNLEVEVSEYLESRS